MGTIVCFLHFKEGYVFLKPVFLFTGLQVSVFKELQIKIQNSIDGKSERYIVKKLLIT